MCSFCIWTGCWVSLCILSGGRKPRTHLQRKQQFCTNIFRLDVWTWYFPWGPINVTILVFQDLNLVFYMAICVPTVMACRLLAVKLYLAATANCNCWVHCSISSCCIAILVKKPTDIWEGYLAWGIHTAFELVKADLVLMVCHDIVW